MEVKKAVASIPSSSEAQLYESDEYESDSEEKEILRELADVSFEEIQKARSNGFVAIKTKVKQEKKGGRANKNRFRKRYSFIYDTNLNAEKQKLKKMAKKSSDPEVVTDLKNNLSFIEKQLSVVASTKQSQTAILSEHKKKEREAAKQGKRPFYLTKSEIRKKELIEKYHKLKAAGKLESFIDKRRKKNASKDHRYVPYRLYPNVDTHELSALGK
ncbi:hypothetical protein GIB67_009431 [Kingdonia uniflora]|uniref:rRNA biogenesis protein RRP36 n=1 Tax=Kingdonia uniflora TaxID=39325 RepID=A0A7J7N3E7_9MAGN|nr:hypothetical protein GIB67_009431 [Kingdonia uniflora]